MYICIYIYIHTYRQALWSAECCTSAPARRCLPLYCGCVCQLRDTVSFHNFKSQNFKLSVSNPKNKYVAYLCVLSQIWNCQGLGRRNKHEVLTTDRIIFYLLLFRSFILLYLFVYRFIVFSYFFLCLLVSSSRGSPY